LRGANGSIELSLSFNLWGLKKKLYEAQIMEYIFKMSNIIFKSVQPILKVSTAAEKC